MTRASALLLTLTLALTLLFACGAAREAPGVPAADVLRDVLAVEFGAAIAPLRAARPTLEPTGWRDGARETWIDETIELGAELETDGGAIRSLSITFGDERANVIEAELSRRLAGGIECSAVPQGIDVAGGFRPMLWRTSDGGSVTMVKKKRILVVKVERPATPAFATAWTNCGGR